jgi:DNA-binding PadR family transcriptional regulator
MSPYDISYHDMANERLSEAAWFVLVALGEGPRHGYAILKDIEEMSDGRVTLSTGTLFGILKRFLELGWIRRAVDPEPKQNLRERQAYALTLAGRKVAMAESKRLEILARLGRRRFGASEG